MNQRLYPWNKWFNRNTYRLKSGEDFSCSVQSMSQQIRNEAARRGAKVSIKTINASVIEVINADP